MNALYAKEWSQLQNHFCPTLKLKQKERIGARYRKRHHTPETPYQRVMNCESVANETKSKLRTLHEILNPFDLKQQIDAKLRHIFSMVKVTSVMRQLLTFGILLLWGNASSRPQLGPRAKSELSPNSSVSRARAHWSYAKQAQWHCRLPFHPKVFGPADYSEPTN